MAEDLEPGVAAALAAPAAAAYLSAAAVDAAMQAAGGVHDALSALLSAYTTTLPLPGTLVVASFRRGRAGAPANTHVTACCTMKPCQFLQGTMFHLRLLHLKIFEGA